MPDIRLMRLLLIFILITGIAAPALAFSPATVSVVYAQDAEEEPAETSAEEMETTGGSTDSTGAAVVGGILALVIGLIFVVAVIGAVALGVIGIGAAQVSTGED